MVDVAAQKVNGLSIKVLELEKKIKKYKAINKKLGAKLNAKVEDLKPVDNFTVTKSGRIRLPKDPKKSYKQIVSFTRSNTNGKVARKAWRLFKSKFKNKKKCAVVYWIGESYFLEKSYNKAIEYFSQIESKFNNCTKLRASYLRIAESLYRIGKGSLALKVLQVMKAKYPKTSFKKSINNLERKIKSSNKNKKRTR